MKYFKNKRLRISDKTTESKYREYFLWAKDNKNKYDINSLADEIINCSVDFFREMKDFVDLQHIFTYYYINYYKSVRLNSSSYKAKDILTFEEYLNEQFSDMKDLWVEFFNHD